MVQHKHFFRTAYSSALFGISLFFGRFPHTRLIKKAAFGTRYAARDYRLCRRFQRNNRCLEQYFQRLLSFAKMHSSLERFTPD